VIGVLLKCDNAYLLGTKRTWQHISNCLDGRAASQCYLRCASFLFKSLYTVARPFHGLCHHIISDNSSVIVDGSDYVLQE